MSQSRQIAASACAALALLVLSGCSLCSPGFIDDYATVGGKWERSDPTTGRVGSPFSDPGTSGDSVYESDYGSVYESDSYYDSEYDQYSESDSVIGGPVEVYDSYPHGGIEIVPQYEGESIILGDEW